MPSLLSHCSRMQDGVRRTYMNAPYAKLSIHDNLKVKIAPVHSDFECSFWLLSLMGSAG